MALRASRLLRPQQVRWMCTAGKVVSVEEIQAEIAACKASMSAPPEPYPSADFIKDLKAGSVKMELLKDVFEGDPKLGDFFIGKIKETQKLAADAKAARAKVGDIDWAEWKEKISMPDVVDQLKIQFEDTTAKDAMYDKLQASWQESITKMAPAMAVAEEQVKEALKESNALLLEQIVELEQLEHKIQNIANLTIPDLLDEKPELKKELEEEIDNHNWAP